MKQILLSDDMKIRTEHGGEFSAGARKSLRPLSSKRAVHLVMRSTRATGASSLLGKENASFVRELVKTLSVRWCVRIYEFSNNGNHLHFLIRAKEKRGFQGFLRVLAGRIAMKVTGSKKGCAQKGRFWDLPAYTRLVEWGRAFLTARRYVIQNRLEAARVIPFQPRTPRKKSSPSDACIGGWSSRSRRP